MKRERLIKERSKINQTQNEVAEQLGITASYYGMIEQGVRSPSLKLARDMENLYGVAMSQLFFANDNNEMLLKPNESNHRTS